MTWVALAGLAGLIGAYLHPVTVDEAWSLVVARRMARGERLYRDVFYGAAPLAICIQALAFRLTRPQGVVVRVLTVGYFFGEVWAAVILLDGRVAPWAVSTVMVALGGFHLHPHNHYGHLTICASAWAAVAVSSGHPWVAGLLAGTAILGRYPVGVLAVGGMAVASAVLDSPVDAVPVLLAATVPTGLAVAARPGGVRWFVRRAVLNKGAYLDAGRESPIRWIRARRWSSWTAIATQAPLVSAMALVAAAPAVAAWRTVTVSSDRPILGLVLTVLGLSAVAPRFDGAHAAPASLLSLPGLLLAVGPGAWVSWVGGVGAVVAAGGVAARGVLLRTRPMRRDLPSLRRLPVHPLRGGVWPDETAGLPRQVFVVRPDAALVYATGGVTNPTPFDYPAVTTFGPDGQSEVIGAYESGMPVCFGWTQPASPLTPTELVEHLRDTAGRSVPLGRVLDPPV